MINCVIVACVIAIASFFAFFGASITYPSSLDIDSPSMFKLMFGYTEEAYGYKVEMKACTGLTILFVIEILIIVLAIVALLIAYKSKNGALFSDDNESIIEKFIYLMIPFSLVACILSFATLGLTGNSTGTSDISLGFGPIIYSILQIIVLIILFVAIYLNKVQNANKKYYDVKHQNTQSYYKPMNNVSSSVTTANKESVLSEKEKLDLLIKYKSLFDSGVVTKEEFEKKKKDLI